MPEHADRDDEDENSVAEHRRLKLRCVQEVEDLRREQERSDQERDADDREGAQRSVAQTGERLRLPGPGFAHPRVERVVDHPREDVQVEHEIRPGLIKPDRHRALDEPEHHGVDPDVGE